MMDRQCDAAIQQKLVDYVRQGGKLVLAGRLCEEDFQHQPCKILREALGLEAVETGKPWMLEDIRVFNYEDVPVSFVETYQGEFDETFAWNAAGEVVGFGKRLGSGTVLVFGAALYTETLEDIDIVNQLALQVGCPPQFKLSQWADIRINRGEHGSFVFMNNYIDDPVDTTVEFEGKPLFGGNTVRLRARRGLILPLEWRLREGVLLHYATEEILQVSEENSKLELKTSRKKFSAELTLKGYTCPEAEILETSHDGQRVRVQGKTGAIVLLREQ
jgi:beta-galactosidase